MIPTALAPLASHLWQSTVFAAVAALLALALRRNQARVRFWLWLAASYKFLLPFALLVSFGHLFQWRTAPAIMPSAFSAVPSAFSTVTDVISGPTFLTALPAAKPAPDHAPALLFVICGVWACGFVIVIAGWAREWLRIRAIVRAAWPLRLDLPIRVVSSSARLEPGVFGIFRPVFLLPDGILDRLTQAELQSIIAHELCHVRRRDNLTAAVHMLVEALFWFHPLVWWLGARMMDERERACDEEVLRAGSQAQAYAEGILKVCELYLESPLTCMSGVTGSDLKKRIQRIMKNQFGVALSAQKKLLLAIAATVALAVPVLAGVVATSQLSQASARLTPSTSSDRPTLNAPSIKPSAVSKPGGEGSSRSGVEYSLDGATTGNVVVPRLSAQSAGQAPSAQPPVAPSPAAQSTTTPAPTPDWQTAAGGKMAFDVASLKPNKSGPSPPATINIAPGFGPGDNYTPTGGLFTATNAPLWQYIYFAYKMSVRQLNDFRSQMPSALANERFDIEARGASDATKDQMRLMLQALLVDRFKLAIHAETRQLPVFDLVLDKPGKLGPQLQPFPDGTPCDSYNSTTGNVAQLPPVAGGFPSLCGGLEGMKASAPGRTKEGGRNVTIQFMTTQFPAMLERPVIDRTGLAGTYDFAIEFTPPALQAPPPGAAPPDPTGPTFLEALKDQLGLRLESATGPADVFVLDHVEEPSGN